MQIEHAAVSIDRNHDTRNPGLFDEGGDFERVLALERIERELNFVGLIDRLAGGPTLFPSAFADHESNIGSGGLVRELQGERSKTPICQIVCTSAAAGSVEKSAEENSTASKRFNAGKSSCISLSLV